MANDITFEVGAKDTGVQATMDSLKATVQEATEAIKGRLEGLTGAFEKMNIAMAGVQNILAGGKLFGEAVSETVNLTKESLALGRQMGVSATTASILKVAMGAAFVTQDQMSAGANKITQALKKNESAFTDLGVATRDSGGHLKSTMDIMLDTNERLMEIKEGTDRNVEGVKTYGRAWADIAPTLKVNKEAMKEAKETADALGLTIGVENVAMVQKYRGSMNDVHEVIEALQKSIGDTLLPSLTSTGEWFKSVGPALVTGLKTAIVDLITVFEYWKASVQTEFEVIKQLWDDYTLGIKTAAQTFAALVMPAYESLKAMASTVLEYIGQAWSTVTSQVNSAYTAVRALLSPLSSVGDLAGTVTNFIGASFDTLSAIVGRFGTYVAKVLHLDLSGAKAAWAAGTANIAAVNKQHTEAIANDWKSAQASIEAANKAAFGKQTEIKTNSGGETSEGGDDKQKSQMAALEAGLEAEKATFAKETLAKGEFIAFSQQQEEDYWAKIKETKDLNAADAVAVQSKIDKETYAIAQTGYQDQLAALKAQESAFTQNLEAKLAIAIQYADKIAKAQPGSKEASKAAAEVTAIEAAQATQNIAIAKNTANAIQGLQMAAIEEAEKQAEAQLARGDITAGQLVAQQRKFEEQKYEIQLDGLQKEFAAEATSPNYSVTKLAQLQQQILTLTTAHNAKLSALDIKAATDSQKRWNDVFKSMESGFATTLTNFMKGTASLATTLKGLFQDITNSIIDMLAQTAAKNAATMLQSVVLSKTAAAAKLESDAETAAGGAYSATAAIPYVGPFLAPAAAAVAYAGVMAFSSAEGGYDIPANVNPITQLHAKEMVLPAQHADTIRAMGDNAAANRAGSPVNFHIQTMDATGVLNTLMANKGAVAKALKAHARSTGTNVASY